MTISNISLIFTTIFVGLMAGLFYSYSCSVSLGLKKLSDTEYILAMQSINRAIQNPVFFISFFGSLVLLPVSTYLEYGNPIVSSFWLLLIAAGLYIIGTFGVTIFGNIPLNNTLDKFDVAGSSKEAITLQRTMFETRWNNLNTIRTATSILSFIILIIACINSSAMNIAAGKS